MKASQMRSIAPGLLAAMVFVALILTHTHASSLSVRPQDQGKRRPNIVFILADDLGYGDLGCYGQKVISTPNLDRMAFEGLRFTSGYATAVCAPSRACLMTGLHPGHCYIRNNSSPEKPLRTQDRTVAEVLRDAGYQTGAIGKWHLGEKGTTGSPSLKGFNYSLTAITDEDSYWPERVVRNNKTMKLSSRIYSQDLYTQEAMDFIRREKGKPFFLYLAYIAPHSPYVPPSTFPYSDEPWSEEDKGFAATITSYLDSDVGRILATLKETGLDDDTIVFFSSDNGPEGKNQFNSEGPFNGLKRTLYEGGIRVPLIVRWPGRIESGISNEPVAIWDFFPTVAELAGAAIPQGIDGKSLVPLLLQGAQQMHEHLYWEFKEKNDKGFIQAVRIGPWKGLQFTTGKRKRPIVNFELYNLDTDIGENNNISDDHPELVERMKAVMVQQHTPSETRRDGAKSPNEGTN